MYYLWDVANPGTGMDVFFFVFWGGGGGGLGNFIGLIVVLGGNPSEKSKLKP